MTSVRGRLWLAGAWRLWIIACLSRGAYDVPLEVLVRPVPVIDGVLAVDVTRDGDHRDEERAMSGEKIAQRKAQEAVGVELLA